MNVAIKKVFTRISQASNDKKKFPHIEVGVGWTSGSVWGHIRFSLGWRRGQSDVDIGFAVDWTSGLVWGGHTFFHKLIAFPILGNI